MDDTTTATIAVPVELLQRTILTVSRALGLIPDGYEGARLAAGEVTDELLALLTNRDKVTM